MADAPVLTTERLTLRPFRPSDLDIQAAVMANPAVVQFLGGSPLSREDTWRRMLCGPGMWTMLGYGYWAVERQGDGAYLGQIGFADFKRDLLPSIEGLPEMGWILAPSAQGKGYCTEAARAALAWADATLGAAQITAIIAPDNAASIRVAERCGFSRAEETRYRDEPILIFRRRVSA